MKRNKQKSQQLSIDFENVIQYENNSFQIKPQETLNYSNNSNCKVISLDYFNQIKDQDLLNKFYSLSNHLD